MFGTLQPLLEASSSSALAVATERHDCLTLLLGVAPGHEEQGALRRGLRSALGEVDPRRGHGMHVETLSSSNKPSLEEACDAKAITQQDYSHWARLARTTESCEDRKTLQLGLYDSPLPLPRS